MTKSGNFENDVRDGFYRWQRNQPGIEQTFHSDFRVWLLTQGVPEQYVDRVSWVAYDRGHAYGEEEVLSFSYDLIHIFVGN